MNDSKILFFDDEALTSESLVRNLCNNYSYDIVYVSSIFDFIDKLTSEKFSLLMIDVMAPVPADLEALGFNKEEIADINATGGMNVGVVLASRVWRIDDYAQVPVIFLTAKSSFQLPRKDNCCILRKPMLAKNISQEIDRLMNKNQVL